MCPPVRPRTRRPVCVQCARPRRPHVRQCRRAVQVHQGRGRRVRRRPLHRPSRHPAAGHAAGLDVRRDMVEDGRGVRRLVDPRLPDHRPVGHGAVPGRRRRTSTRSARKTIAMDFFVHDPITGEAYSRDPRNIARKAEAYLATTGIGDTAFFAPEAEFYIFDRVTTARPPTRASTRSTRSRPPGPPATRTRQPRLQGPLQGRLLPRPADRPLRRPAQRHDDQPRATRACILERGHHEVGTAGQAEINYRFDTLLKAADDVMKFKYIVRNTAWANDKTGDLHAEADLRRQRLGHARATSRSGTTASRCSTTRPATADCRTWRATTSAAS